MSFEARHKLLKQLSTAMCNFVNISKSLANQFQQHMCYQQLNTENYLKQETSVPKSLSNHDKQGLWHMMTIVISSCQKAPHRCQLQRMPDAEDVRDCFALQQYLSKLSCQWSNYD
jgi:hypothetical protein